MSDMDGLGITALERAIEILGGQVPTGKVCGVGQSTVSECIRNGKKVPAEWCLPLEKATAEKGDVVWRHQFRPDLYPVEDMPQRLCPPQRVSSPANHPERKSARAAAR